MNGRPEATDGGYREFDNDYDRDAWQEFTPWRPGDPSTKGEGPPPYAHDHAQPDGWFRTLFSAADPQRSVPKSPQSGKLTDRPSRWWTEDVPERFQPGERVRNNTPIHGKLGMQHVPDNTKGEVISTRHGLLGGEYVTIRFENGYIEEVDINTIERRSWWD
ncbi:hypothetical protein [Actinokineospora fastidiosa]|uniref:Uncharacterized protein n=1 Tax=Actinokineospora fastidiosa TaxID=1816 RepID=A0A918GSH6_9PSEU|nr:hypothetical protein [Actinokineospora fastidiosa]GGS54493.1 hypothetical protein GCM10010171_57050 [Actinokineospora fastidiosa]